MQWFDKSISNCQEFYDDGFLRIEFSHCYIACGGKIVSLSRAEFLIASVLAMYPDRFVQSRDIWSYVWADAKPLNQESLKVTVCKLRRRLNPYGVAIESKCGFGYKLVSCRDTQ